jgi:hypothetical protein
MVVHLRSWLDRVCVAASASEYASESGNENENDCLNWSTHVGDGVVRCTSGHHNEIFCDDGDESANENVEHHVVSVYEHEVVVTSA